MCEGLGPGSPGLMSTLCSLLTDLYSHFFWNWLESLLCMSVHDPPHSIHGPQTPNTQLKLSKSCTEPQSRLLFPSGLAAVVQALILQPFDLMLISKIYLKGVLMWCEWTLTRWVKVASNAGRHTPLFKHRYSHYAFSIPVSRDELV